MNNIQKLVETRQSLYKITMDLMKTSSFKTLNEFYKHCKFAEKEKWYITTIMVLYNHSNVLQLELIYDENKGKKMSFTEELNIMKRCTNKIIRKYNF